MDEEYRNVKTKIQAMLDKTDGVKCLVHKFAAVITIEGVYPGEILVKTCCKEFGDHIANICDIVQVHRFKK